jgi:hypothetical protein
MPSKMVTDRQKSATAVETAAQVHAEEAASGLAPLLAAELLPDEELPDLALLQRLLARALARRRERMVAADEAHLSELADDVDPRRRRDEAAAELRDRLSGVRQTVEGLFGPAQGGELFGIGGELAFDPVVVHRQAERALAFLRARTAADLPAPGLPGVTVDPAAWAAMLEEPVATLAAALGEVDRERREAETTLTEKTAALTAYDATFGRVARLMEALFAAADLPLLAERVRPSSRRPGRTAEDTEGERDGEPSPAPPEPARPAAPAAGGAGR